MTTTFAGILLVLAAVALAVTATLGMRRDPRSLGNASLLALTAVAAALGVTLLGSRTFTSAAFVLALISPLLTAVLVGFLLWNGVTMMRKEGRTLGNLLSLLAGLAVMAAVVTCAVLMFTWPAMLPVMLLIVLGCAWVAALFCGFVAYSWLYQRLVRSRRPDFIVALGSGLIGDRVPPLLAGRIDRAITLYREERATGRAPVLVMSGGQGSDELLSEAEAMGRYALDKGIPAEDLLLETASATTAQNLRNTLELVRADPRLGAQARGVAVTSNYHAMRAAMLARRLGVPVDAVGARTARYFWPSAMLREFIAVVRESLPLQLFAAALVVLPLPVAFTWAIWFR